MEKRQERTGCRKNGHDAVHVMAEMMKKRHPVQLTVFQDKRQVFDAQDEKVAGQAKGHFREHGMHVGMPENEPAPHGLPHIDAEDQQGRTVADKTDQHRVVNDIFQFVFSTRYLRKPLKNAPPPRAITERSAQIHMANP